MSQNTWFEHFKEQLQGLTEAYESSGSALSLLGYALKEKRLSSEEYLKWAVTHHQLPKLQSRFFTETQLSQEMFAKWATHYRWSAECLPVAEWDGSLIVVCLQPPQDFPSFPTAALVLTELENIEKAWDLFHPKAAAAPAEATVVAPTQIPKKSSDSFSFEDLGVTPDSEVSETTNSGVELSSEDGEGKEESNPDDALAGLFDGPTVVKLEAVGGSPLEKTVVLEKTAAPAPAPAPVPVAEATVSGLTGLSKIVPPEPPPSTVPKLEATQPTISVAKTPAGPPPPPKQSEVDLSDDSFANKKIPIVARPAGVAKPIVNPVASGHFSLEKIKKKNSGTINDRIKEVLSEMKIYFEKSMILTLDEQETQLVAFAWDENFKGIKDTSMRFPLKTPSIFNIVASTQKPYHGYVSLNEINERFFDDWNQGVVPDHVTITPLMVQEKMVGMLIGFADKTAYNKVSLTLAEKLSGEFVKDLQAA
ncbi:hypothetical protein AZI86_14430 [Bdellovibrio bacteriovorus]|uniref:Uncharacterized protein n=1 Tax=Bdellovibrio bacteriovorus TaxID=959 RepID=A0A150WJX8_BDEBC|nr:hypothetical protein [Bdellovibrio bacteriovorus]KYG64000.1 hypothetical protein AZI86_14430 [Bdellovibrio bacteriovorus]